MENKATGECEWNNHDELCEWLKSKRIHRDEDEKRKELAKRMWENGLSDVKAIGTNAGLLMQVLDVNLGVANKLIDTQGTQATGGEMKISAGELAYAWLEEVKADNGSTPAPEQAYALYHEVAKVASGDSESQLLVKDLVNKQPKRAATPTAVQVAPWICVAASSGTGKTQLAVTARAYVDKVQPTKVVYLFMGALGEAQTFYRLHANLGMKIRREFGDKPFDKEGTSPHDLREGTSCKAYGLLRALLCETETLDKSVQPCSLSDLREAVWQLDKKLLVFLDEVPKRDAKDFRSCMVLRSVLRRIGVAPILMSTHTGSMDVVLTGSRQSGDVELFQESADYVLTLGKRRSVDVRVTISGVRPVATSVGKRRRERAHDQFNRRATKLRAVDLTSPSTDTSPDSGE